MTNFSFGGKTHRVLYTGRGGLPRINSMGTRSQATYTRSLPRMNHIAKRKHEPSARIPLPLIMYKKNLIYLFHSIILFSYAPRVTETPFLFDNRCGSDSIAAADSPAKRKDSGYPSIRKVTTGDTDSSRGDNEVGCFLMPSRTRGLRACLEDEPATITTRGSRLSKNSRSGEFQVRYEFILGHNGMRRLGTILIGSNAKNRIKNRENADLVVLELILIMRIGEHAPKGTPLLEVISRCQHPFLIQQRKNIKHLILM